MAKDRISELYERQRLFHKDHPNTSERHPHPVSAPHPRGGFDQMGRHDEIHRPQFPEDHRDVSPRHSGDESNRYHNEHERNYVRGHHHSKPEIESAEGKPHFDHGHLRPSMQANRGNTWARSPSDSASTHQDGDRRHGLDQSPRFQGGMAASRKKGK